MQKIMDCGELIILRDNKMNAIKDCCVVFDKRIIDFGERQKILRKYGGDILDAKDKVVMPGFVDSHTHAVFAGTRENELEMKLRGKSYMEILKSGGGINRTVVATQNASESEILKESLERVNRCLKHGTTTIEIKNGYGIDVENELKLLNVVRQIKEGGKISVVPTHLAHIMRDEGYVEYFLDNLGYFRDKAEFFDVFMEAFGKAHTIRLLKKGKELGFRLKLHADEFVDMGGAKLGAEFGCVSVDHMISASEDGLKAMKASNSVACLLPATSFSSFERYADARKMVEIGLPIALATDLNPNCYCENMQFVMQLACYKMKLLPEKIMEAATINGAKALGMEKEVGSIERGKRADLVVINAKNYAQIFNHFGVNLVEKVIKNGEVVVDNTDTK